MKICHAKNRSIQLLGIFHDLIMFIPAMLKKKLFLSHHILLVFVAFTIPVACGEYPDYSSLVYQNPVPGPIPSQPSGLTARAVYSNQIDLSWNESIDDSGTPAYGIYRNDSFIQYVNSTKFSDTGLNPDTQYCYQVYAYDSDGHESIFSKEACAVTSWIISDTNIGHCYSGSIAIDSSGKVNYGCQSEAYGYNYIFATKTQDFWLVEQLNLPGTADYSSMAIDSVDMAHISHAGPNDYLYYATNSSGIWESEIIDNTSLVTSTSIAADSSDCIHISYSFMSGDLWTIKYATNSSGNWTTEILESLNVYGEYRSLNACPIAVDLNGDVHISYVSYDLNGKGSLKYITNASGTWSTDTVVMGGELETYSAIAVDSAGNVNIIYIDHEHSGLNYATNSSGVWVSEPVEAYYDHSPEYFTLAVDSYGNSHITYTQVMYASKSLFYAKNVSGTWETYIIDNAGIQDDPNPTTIAIDADDKVHIIYDTYSALKYVTNR